MSVLLQRLTRALTRNTAATRGDHEDPALRGRTYGIPFDTVWNEALSIAEARRRWEVVERDDLEGVIRIEATSLVFRFVDDLELRVILDRNGQTRVDARSESRVGKADLGANARRIRSFFKKLDRGLAEASDSGLDRLLHSTPSA